MSHLLERNHHQQLQGEPGNGRSRHGLERRKACPQALRDDGAQVNSRTRFVCRRFVLRLVNEALNAQTTASECLRPSKKRKLNSHSGGVVSSLASPGRRSDQSDAPAPSKERPNVDVGTSDDEVEQEIGTSSESPTSKVLLSTGYRSLISTIL